MKVKILWSLVMIKMIILLIIVIAASFILQLTIPVYDKCYQDMENRGYAVFGYCGGLSGGTWNTGYLQEQCVYCPYYVEINSENRRKR